MDINSSVEAFRSLTWGMLELLAPSLVVGFVIAILVGVIQAMTQIQEQTLSFLPKLLALFGVLYYLAPWMMDKLVTLMQTHIESIPGMW